MLVVDFARKTYNPSFSGVIGLRVRSVVESVPDLTHEVVESFGLSLPGVHVVEDAPGRLLDLFDLGLILEGLRNGDEGDDTEHDGQRREHGFPFIEIDSSHYKNCKKCSKAYTPCKVYRFFESSSDGTSAFRMPSRRGRESARN